MKIKKRIALKREYNAIVLTQKVTFCKKITRIILRKEIMKHIITLQISLLVLCTSLSSAATPSMVNPSGKTPLFMMGSNTSNEKTSTPAPEASSTSITILPNPAIAMATQPLAENDSINTPAAPTALMTNTEVPPTETTPAEILEKKDEISSTSNSENPNNETTSIEKQTNEPKNEAVSETTQEKEATPEPMLTTITEESQPSETTADSNPSKKELTLPTESENKADNQIESEEPTEKTEESITNNNEDQMALEPEEVVEEIIVEEKEIIVMNSTGQKIAIYGQDSQDHEICIAQHLGPIAKIVIPTTIHYLRVACNNPSYIETAESIIENNNLSIIGIQNTNDYDATENTLQIISLKEESEQGLVIYNTTTKNQKIKAVYPDDASFFYTPKIYYTIPALSARFMTLPIFNQKGIQTKVHLTLDHSKKKISIPAGTAHTICAIYQEDGIVMIDNITEHFM